MNKEIDLKQIAPYLVLGLCFLLFLYFRTSYVKSMEATVAQSTTLLQSIAEQKSTFGQIQEARNVHTPQGERASFAKVQGILSENGLNNHIRQIEPQVSEQDLIIEERISLTLQDLDLTQLTKLLHAIEIASSGLTVENINISRNNREFLDVELTIKSQAAK